MSGCLDHCVTVCEQVTLKSVRQSCQQNMRRLSRWTWVLGMAVGTKRKQACARLRTTSGQRRHFGIVRGVRLVAYGCCMRTAPLAAHGLLTRQYGLPLVTKLERSLSAQKAAVLMLVWTPADPHASHRPSGEAVQPGGLHSPAFAGHHSPTHQVQLRQLWWCPKQTPSP